MSKILTTDRRCQRCGGMIPAGERARGSLNIRHYDACPSPAEIGQQPGTATDRQIGYALDLQTAYWTPAVFGGHRYAREELVGLSRQAISRVIEMLLTERDLQGGD